MRPRPLAVVGALVCLAGGVVLFDAGVAAVVDLGTVALTVVGLLATVQAVRFLYLARRESVDGVELEDPEASEAGGIPGSGVDRLLAEDPAPAEVDTLRARFRTVAADRLAVATGTTDDEARGALADGTWTDDPDALAFLDADREYALGIRLRALLGGPHPDAVGFERAVAALRAVEAAGEFGKSDGRSVDRDADGRSAHRDAGGRSVDEAVGDDGTADEAVGDGGVADV